MATITDTTTDANGNTIINMSSSEDDSITLATAGTYFDKNIIFNITASTELILQEKSVTPSTAAQEVTPDSRYDGLSKVNVDAIPSSYTNTSDATAAADEILKGETAYVNGSKVTGTFTIDNELTAQDDLIAQIQSAVNNLPEADGGSGSTLISGQLTGTSVSVYIPDQEQVFFYYDLSEFSNQLMIYLSVYSTNDTAAMNPRHILCTRDDLSSPFEITSYWIGDALDPPTMGDTNILGAPYTSLYYIAV